MRISLISFTHSQNTECKSTFAGCQLTCTLSHPVTVMTSLFGPDRLTGGAAALVLDADGFLAQCLGCPAGALQCTAALVRQPVVPAHLVVALTHADSQLVLLVLIIFDALQPGAAAARSRAAPAAQLSLRGGAHRAAAAAVQQRAGTAPFHRERSAGSRLTRSAAWTR